MPVCVGDGPDGDAVVGGVVVILVVRVVNFVVEVEGAGAGNSPSHSTQYDVPGVTPLAHPDPTAATL